MPKLQNKELQTKLNQLTIKEALLGLKNQKFSCVELTQACIDQINKLDPKIKAFVTYSFEKAIKEAQEVDKK